MTSNLTSWKKTSRNKHFHIPVRPLNLWQNESANQEVRIEIIPLIDVIFCILTFFLLAAVGFSRQQAISLDLPKASTGTSQMREMLIVSLDDLGQVYVEQQVVTRNQLYQAINNYHKLNPAGMMVLYASRNASYNEVVQVLDMLREVGGNKVALATLPGKSDVTETTNTNTYPGNENYPYSTNSPGNYPNPSQMPNTTQYQYNNYDTTNQGTPNRPGPPSN